MIFVVLLYSHNYFYLIRFLKYLQFSTSSLLEKNNIVDYLKFIIENWTNMIHNICIAAFTDSSFS